MKLLMIDNYDSFTYNIVQYFGELGADVTVVRNDEITLEEVIALVAEQGMERVVISPGPSSPKEAGISVAAIQHFAGKLPVLGVCLGHQSIGAAFGGDIIRAGQQMHGKTSVITTDQQGVFAGLPKQFTVNAAGLPGNYRDQRGRRNPGRAPQDAGRGGRAVPPRKHLDRARPRHAQKLPRPEVSPKAALLHAGGLCF